MASLSGSIRNDFHLQSARIDRSFILQQPSSISGQLLPNISLSFILLLEFIVGIRSNRHVIPDVPLIRIFQIFRTNIFIFLFTSFILSSIETFPLNNFQTNHNIANYYHFESLSRSLFTLDAGKSSFTMYLGLIVAKRESHSLQMTRYRPTFIMVSRVSLGGSVASRVTTQLIRPRGYIIHLDSPHTWAWRCLHLINHLGAAQYHRAILSIRRLSQNHLLYGTIHQLAVADIYRRIFSYD